MAQVERGPAFSEDIIKALAKKIQPYNVQTMYQFPVSQEAIDRLEKLLPVGTAFDIARQDMPYDKTLALRKLFSDPELWNHDSRRVEFANWVVSDWGGLRKSASVKRSDKDRKAFEELIREADSAERSGKFAGAGIASWSKYLAFRYPKRFAIYDARTAYSLNWLLSQCDAKKYFRFPKGRNSLLNAFDYRLWLAAKVIGRERVGDIIEVDVLNRERDGGDSRAVSDCMKELELRNRSFYADYCELLISVAREVYPDDLAWGLTKVEMTLFGIATTDIIREVFATLVPSGVGDSSNPLSGPRTS